MRNIILAVAALCFLVLHNNTYAQKKSKKVASKTTATSKSKKPGANTRSNKSSKAKAKKTSATPAALPPLVLTSDFEKANTLHGNGKGTDAAILNPAAIENLNSFINSCIAQRAFPGCQILAAKDGAIIYKKNFGYFTYDKSTPVTDTTIYDIASVSKVAATTLAVMKLYEEGKINLNTYLKNYLPFTIGTNKAYLTVADLLLHQAGLKAYIPFYKETIDTQTGGPRSDLYRVAPEPMFNTPVASNFYIKNSFRDTIWGEILASNLDNKGRYVYSDLDFYFLQKIVEAVSGLSLDQYVYQNFYSPLGLHFTGYNPWKKGWKNQCAPTENDDYFRFQLTQGYVHDPGTAMLGGIAGHAGIFSTASELAIILQMLNNGGIYKGKRYLKKETVQLFSGYNSAISRRGYGFDKPEKARGDGGPACDLCSKTTFGHQGFTGTCAWADPETGITFVFLSNRVYPSADNGLINKLGVRGKAQNYIYQALGYGK
ncbi:MAG: serine hydrolase domain-containing protein [Edaphocola sp.]